MPRWFTYLLLILLVVGLPPFLVLSNLYLLATPTYLDYEYAKLDFPPADLFGNADRRTFAAASIEYIRGNLSYQEFKALGVYNDREIKHMVDVRNLIATVMSLHINVGAVILIALVTLAWTKSTRPLAGRGLVAGGILTIAIFAAVGLFAAAAFNVLFTSFHHLFFEGDSWLFYTTDSLIQFYPLRFWFDTSIALVGLTIAEALLVALVGWAWSRHAMRAAAATQPVANKH